MTDAEWALVRDCLPVPLWLEGRGGQPEGYCHRQMLDAVRYLVAGGITWRAMPGDFPAWDRVYAFARRWRVKGLPAELYDRLRGLVREEAGRDPEPTAAVIDAQSLRAAATVPAATRGYDGAKKVPGRKRHIVVDCLGLLLAVMVTAANMTDQDAAMPLLERVRAAIAGSSWCGPTAATRVAWSAGRSSNWGSLWRSSSAATTPRGSWCCPDAGWWNAR
ncbi:transposase [Streptomyces sp. MB09-01]|nr:transposase [Streptomyces sp. MB09-01]